MAYVENTKYMEHERKFIVNRGFLDEIYDNSIGSVVVKQGYLNINKSSSIVQARFTHNITKHIGIGNAKGVLNGASRPEFEWKMEENTVIELLKCIPNTIYKRRVYLIHDGRKWSVDVYLDDNAPLIIAEIECPDPDDLVAACKNLPKWVMSDVTDKEEYYNKNLAFNPYSQWGQIVTVQKPASTYQQAN